MCNKIMKLGRNSRTSNAAHVLANEILSQKSAPWQLMTCNEVDIETFGWSSKKNHTLNVRKEIVAVGGRVRS